jgi:hypothetical protein
MGSIGKGFSLLLVVTLAVSSLMMVESAFAQSIPKPSVPEFTAKYIDNSYDVPLTTTTDPYTGKTVTQGGYHVIGEPEIEITIKNPNDTHVFYSVRTKGHFSQNWVVVEYWHQLSNTGQSYNPPNPYPQQNYSSQYTVLRFGDEGSGIPSEGQMDIQVEALIGSVKVGGDSDHSALYNMFYPTYDFSGETSGWSDTQTVSIASQSILSFGTISLLVIAFMVIAAVSTIIIVVFLLLFRRHRKPID